MRYGLLPTLCDHAEIALVTQAADRCVLFLASYAALLALHFDKASGIRAAALRNHQIRYALAQTLSDHLVTCALAALPRVGNGEREKSRVIQFDIRKECRLLIVF